MKIPTDELYGSFILSAAVIVLLPIFIETAASILLSL